VRTVFALFLLFLVVCANAQHDSLRSPFSVYGGADIGVGRLFIGNTHLVHGYDELQYGRKAYVNLQFKFGLLWEEKYGIAWVAGQISNTTDAQQYKTYADGAINGYKFLVEYSDLHQGYTYRYLTPQFVYRFGREPFNLTLNGGLGIGIIQSATGIAIYQKDSSNGFIEARYYAEPTMNFNAALGVEFAYMRQLSQHWFMNCGLSLSYVGLLQDYEVRSTRHHYQAQFPITNVSQINGLLSHGAAGIFLHFQWNTKESERAYYE